MIFFVCFNRVPSCNGRVYDLLESSDKAYEFAEIF